MKTFQDFMLEYYSIQESSLSRVVSKIKGGGIAIISAERGDKTNKQNQQASSRLTRRVRGAGLPGPTQERIPAAHIVSKRKIFCS